MTPSFRNIILIVLVAIWLPATQHCGLAAAGLIGAESSHDVDAGCCQTGDGSCAHDGCKVVESGLIKSDNETIKVPMPALAACACFLCLQLSPRFEATEPSFGVTASESPQHWVPVWQFVRRAAPLSRAPSCLG